MNASSSRLRARRRVLLATSGRESSSYAIHRWRLARALCEGGRCSEAEPVVEEAISLLEAMSAAAEPQLALALTVRAEVRGDRGAMVEAEDDLRRALGIQRRTYPPGHYAVGRTLGLLAAALLAADRPAEAAPLAREALHSREACLPEEHPLRARAGATLASAEARLGSRPG